MGNVLQPQGYLFSGQRASGAYSAMDCRSTQANAQFAHWSQSNSAILKLQASPDGNTGWVDILTVTALTTVTQVQISAFHAYVRGAVVTGWTSYTAFATYNPVLR